MTAASTAAAQPVPPRTTAGSSRGACCARCCRRCRWRWCCWRSPVSIRAPSAISASRLMLNLAIPIALATIAQMFVITGNDLDLSIGTFVGFVGCVTATWLRDTPLARRPRAPRLHRRLRGARRADLSAQPALDRGDARHELRLAGPRHPALAEARRQGARLAAGDHGLQAALRSVPDPRRDRHRRRRLFRPDAHLLWRHPARLGRQCRRHRPCRLVAAQGQDGPVRAAPACSACSRAWR